MDTTYFEGRLKASISMMNAASDPCARMAHRGLVKGYRGLVAAGGRPTKASREFALPLPGYNMGHALAEWADDDAQ